MISRSSAKLGYLGSNLGHRAKSKEYLVYTQEVTVLDFFFFQKNLSFKKRCPGGWALNFVTGLPFDQPFFEEYVTFIIQWIAFIFGRDKEEDQ